MVESLRRCVVRGFTSVQASMRALAGPQPERGDVPGWVLVAVMTAGLVTAIWLIADDALTAVLDRALSSVAVRN